MKKLKVTFAIAAVLCALGTTYAANQKVADALNCSTDPSGSPVDHDRAKCDGTVNICCYDANGAPLLLGNRTF